MIFVSGTAAAQAGNAAGLYANLRIGPSFVQDMNFAEATTANLALDPDVGFVINGAVGYRFNDAIRLEFDLGYGRNDLTGAFQQNVQVLVPCGEITSAPCLDPDVNGEIATLSGFATAYYDLPVAGPLKPYVGAGIGLVEADMNVGTRAALNSGAVSRYAIIDGADTLLGYRALLGVNYDLGGVGSQLRLQLYGHRGHEPCRAGHLCDLRLRPPRDGT